MRVISAGFTVLGLVTAASLALAGGPETATNPTSSQPADANTPTQAARDTEDNKVTEQIRAALMADQSLSPQAKRVDVRTNPDAITLRGSVSAAEKERIEHVAGQYAGARQVTSQLLIQGY